MEYINEVKAYLGDQFVRQLLEADFLLAVNQGKSVM